MSNIKNSDKPQTTPVLNSLADNISNFMKFREEYFVLRDKFHIENQNLEISVKNLIDRTLREFSLERNVHVYFTLTSQLWNGNTKDWEYKDDPHFYINHLTEGSYGLGQRLFVNIAGKWIHTKKIAGYKVYSHDLDCQAQLKEINLNDLAEACAVLTEKTGCRVEHTQHDIVNASDITIPKNEDDLIVKHSGARIVASGKKWHEGWDIPDHWAIIQTRKNHLIIYYSTNGHGFGYDTVVMPDKPVTDFLYWLDGGDKNKRQSLLSADIMKKLDARGV